MRNFIYRCPVVGLNVQGSVEAKEAEGKTHVMLVCLACGRAHLVNPVTGKLISENSRPRDDS